MAGAAAGFPAAEPLRDAQEARPPERPRFRKILQRDEVRTPERDQFAGGIGRQRLGMALGEFADRIELGHDARYRIFDYKTGSARSEPQVRTGLAPQLTLEAAILRKGGFPGIPAKSSVAEIAYVLVKGGEPPGESKFISFRDGNADSQADRALDKLTELAKRFEDEDTPYCSLVHPMWKTHYGDYDHLARVLEWTSAGEEDDDGGGE